MLRLPSWKRLSPGSFGNMRINVKLHDTLGCTVVASVVLQSLRHAFSRDEFVAYTAFPDLLQGLTEIDRTIDSNKQSLPSYELDFRSYLENRKPQESRPLRNLSEHMFEMAEEQLGSKLQQRLNRQFEPKVNLTKSEVVEASRIVKSRSSGRPPVWIQSKTRDPRKDWPEASWHELRAREKERYSFIDLSREHFPRRVSIAITQQCVAGITLDTFLLHGSRAVGAKNVVVILVSSHPEVVTYKGQRVLDGLRNSNNITVENVAEHLDKLIARKD